MPPPPSSTSSADFDPKLHAVVVRQRLETLGSLAGGLASDLGAMFDGILAQTGTVETKLAPDHPARTELALVQGTAHRGCTLTRRIATFADADGPAHAPQDLVAVLQTALLLLRSAAPTGMIVRSRFEVTRAPALVDAVALQQVVLILGFDAIEPRERDGATVDVTLRRHSLAAPSVAVGTLDRGAHLCISIAVTGARLFGPNAVQALTSATWDEVGLGRSLAVVRHLMLQHGGGIAVEQSETVGTVMHLYFPEPPAGPTSLDHGPAIRAARVAIIEDEESVARMTEQSLRLAGHSTTLLSGAAECLKHLQRDAHAYDLVIADQRLAGFTGLELAWALRERGIPTPVLIMSGTALLGTQPPAAALEAVHFLAKPFTLRELMQAVRAALDPAAQLGKSTDLSDVSF
ncbi:MAG TPA: response regulator [Candidatus Synoicihabitans sp.]|nr:response regulator [Candidatus Synoicihabitans sp.]